MTQIDVRVYSRVLYERDGLRDRLALANLRAGIAEAVLASLVCSDRAVMNWRCVDIPAAIAAIAGSGGDDCLDSADIHDFLNDAPGG